MRIRTILAATAAASVLLTATPAMAAAPTALSAATAIANDLNKKMGNFVSDFDASLEVQAFATSLPSVSVSPYTVRTETESLAGWSVSSNTKVACVVMGLQNRYVAYNGSCIAWYAANRTKILAKSSLAVMDQIAAAAFRQAQAEAVFNGTKPTMKAVAAAASSAPGSNDITITWTKTSMKMKSAYAIGRYFFRGSTISR